MSSNNNDEIDAHLLGSLRALGRAETVTEPIAEDRLMTAVQAVLTEADECSCGRLSRGKGAQQIVLLRRLLAERTLAPESPA